MCLCNFVTSRICMFVPFRSTVRSAAPPPPSPVFIGARPPPLHPLSHCLLHPSNQSRYRACG